MEHYQKEISAVAETFLTWKMLNVSFWFCMNILDYLLLF